MGSQGSFVRIRVNRGKKIGDFAHFLTPVLETQMMLCKK